MKLDWHNIIRKYLKDNFLKEIFWWSFGAASYLQSCPVYTKQQTFDPNLMQLSASAQEDLELQIKNVLSIFKAQYCLKQYFTCVK